MSNWDEEDELLHALGNLRPLSIADAIADERP